MIITWGVILSLVFFLWWGAAFKVGKGTKKVACKNPESVECSDWNKKNKKIKPNKEAI